MFCAKTFLKGPTLPVVTNVGSLAADDGVPRSHEGCGARIEPARIVSPERRWEESSIERSGGLSFLRHSLSLRVPFAAGTPGNHRSENKLSRAQLHNGSEKIVSVSILGLNSIFAM